MSPCDWHDEATDAAIMRGAARGLRAWAKSVLAESQEIVPVAEVRGGYLRDTGDVDVDTEELVATVSYSSPPRRDKGRRGIRTIASWVHEDLSAKHTGGRTAKYLERPAKKSARTGPKIVADEIRKELT